jgi:hypothetical protein
MAGMENSHQLRPEDFPSFTTVTTDNVAWDTNKDISLLVLGN